MKVAVVCSWLNQYGGAERVLEVLHDMYPTAPVYTAMFEPRVMPAAYQTWDIRTSFLQRLPFVKKHHQLFLALYPLAFEQFDLSEYDVVISNTSAFAHGVITPPHAFHACYCLTPARFLWTFADYAQREEIGRRRRGLLAPLIGWLRMWDAVAAQRVDHFIAISEAVAARIEKYYRRSSDIIHPPVNTAAYSRSTGYDDFFLVVSRLVPYKRIELAVEACSQLGLPLKVAGDGRYRRALEARAGPTVEFLGRVDDATLKELYARCKALIFPGEEDFGLTPLEAQASGRPVIAYAAGGALETVVEGETGAFFRAPTAESLAVALLEFDPDEYDPQRIWRHAAGFDVEVFKMRFSSLIEERYAEYSERAGLLRR